MNLYRSATMDFESRPCIGVKDNLTVVGYRKDIDGLRAIAVLLVLFYHLGSVYVPGGFLGVDIFLVISGYLISFNIVNGLTAGKFLLKEFYLRRIRRILPVFVVVVFATIVSGFFILIPSDLKLLSVSSLFSLLSVSNIYFWKVISVGYFHPDAAVLPLLHTWSLSVEEQFYFFWPVSLFILFSILNQPGSKNLIHKLGVITIAFSIISFCLY